jgi:uncharacterized membrane protein YhfC
MLEIFYVVNFLGMILLPILVGIYSARKFNLSWKLFLAGGLTFIASQVLHVPLVFSLSKTFLSWGDIAYAIVLGLLAGLFEETARYILFKFILKKSRSWNEALFIGLGHGGVEAIILGILAGVAFVTMLIYRSIDLSTVPSIPAEQLELARQQVAAYWSTPAYMALLGVSERIFAICLHLSLSVLVMYGLVKKQAIWFWLAILWHAIIDASAVFLVKQIGALSIEGLLGIFAVISLLIIFWLKTRFLAEVEVTSPVVSDGQ